MRKILVVFSLIFSVALFATPQINELYYDTSLTGDAGSFTEIKGDPGESLDNYSLIGVNGGDGTVYATIDLSGYTIPSDSYFVVADSNIVSNYDIIDALVDWQNGPDNVILVYDDGTTVDTVDAVGYGNFSSATFVGRGDATVDVSADIALARRSDTDNNAVDFIGTDTPTPGTANTYDEGTVHTIYDIQYVTDPETDDASPLLDSLVQFTAVVTANTGYKLYVQDGNGEWDGVVVYTGYNVNPGDSITVIGKVTEYYNLTEISPVYALTPNGGTGAVNPSVITGDLIGEAYEGQFVRILNAEVVNDSLGYGEWLINDGNGDVRVDDEMYEITPDSGHVYAYVQGALNYSYSNYKVEPRDENDLVDYATVSGTIDLSDSPTDLSGSVVTMTDGTNTYTNTTVSDGSYSIESIIPGTYTIEISHDGYETIVDTVDVSADLAYDVTLTLITYTVSGTIGLSDSPADLSGTTISLDDGTNTYSATTASDGTYSITDVIPGTYTLIASHDGYFPDTTTIDVAGDVTYSATLEFDNSGITDAVVFKIEKPAPNPFKSVTTVELSVPNSADVAIKIYDITGKLIKVVKEGTLTKGKYSFTWDRKDRTGSTVPSGLYFMRVNYNKDSFLYRLVVLK